MGMSIFLSHSSSLMYTPSDFDFLLQPIFLRGFSGSLHLVLLLSLFLSWVCRKIRVRRRNEGPKQSSRKSRFSYYNPILFCCLGLSIFNLVLCFLNYFFWYRNGWSDEKVITLLDSVLRTLAWLSISVYLHTHFVNSGEPKLPISLRIWWGFYFLISCYSLVIDFFFKKEDQSLPTQLLVSDVISTVSGLFLCFVGFLGKKASEETLLQEPLLNASSNLTSNGTESNKSSVGGIVAPCSNASIFSILTFSWMGRLIGTGYKKALDLDDVPQLDGVDSVKGAFQIFTTKLAV